MIRISALLAGFGGENGEAGIGVPGMVMGFPHRWQGPDCPTYWPATVVSKPQ
jgi:hypothetical protein